MSWVLANRLLLAMMTGQAPDFDTDSFGILLVKHGYAPDLGDAGVEFVSDLVPATNELTGGGYARRTLASVTLTLVSGVAIFDAADMPDYAEDPGGFTDAGQAVIYRDDASDAARRVVAALALPAAVGNVAAAFAIIFAADGIVALTKS